MILTAVVEVVGPLAQQDQNEGAFERAKHAARLRPEIPILTKQRRYAVALKRTLCLVL